MEKSTVPAPAAGVKTHQSFGAQPRQETRLTGETRLWPGGTSSPPSSAPGRRLPRVIAATLVLLSGVAAAIHFLVVPEHLEEYLAFGVFFIVIGVAQGLWALLIGLAPTRGLIVSGIIGNAAIVMIWALSRTVGLPVGPEPWTPESAGLWDVLSTACEILIVSWLLWLAWRSRRSWLSSPTGAGW